MYVGLRHEFDGASYFRRCWHRNPSRRTHLVNRDAARPRPSCELRRYGGQQTPMRVERVTSEQTRRTQSTQCADLWFLPSSSSHSAPGASICIHRRRNGVDAVEPAPAKYCKDRSYLVRIESTASSTTTGRSKSWYWPMSCLGSRPRNLRCDVSMRTKEWHGSSICGITAVYRGIRDIIAGIGLKFTVVRR